MKTLLKPSITRILLSFLLLGIGVAAEPKQPLPPDTAISTNAGRGGLLFVALQMESGEEFPFMVDTGAAVTLFDISLEHGLGNRIGTNHIDHFASTYEAGVYPAPKLYLGGSPMVMDGKVFAYDFKGQLASRAGKQILGVLGMDCLKHYCLQLDFEAGKLCFLDSDRMKVETLGKAFPITISNPGNRPFIDHLGLAGGTNTHCLIDTGCNYDGRVEKGTIPGSDGAWRHLPECVWDGETYTNLSIQVGEHANMIGLRFLARHLVTLDFPRQTMYLKKTSIGPRLDEPRKDQPNPQGGANGSQPISSETNRSSSAGGSGR